MSTFLPPVSLLAPAPADSMAATMLAGIAGKHPINKWESRSEGATLAGEKSLGGPREGRPVWRESAEPLPPAVAERIGEFGPEAFGTRARAWVFEDGSVYAVLAWFTAADCRQQDGAVLCFRSVVVSEHATTLEACRDAFGRVRASRHGASLPPGTGSSVRCEIVEGQQYCFSGSHSVEWFGEVREGVSLALIPPSTPTETFGAMSTDALRYGAPWSGSRMVHIAVPAVWPAKEPEPAPAPAPAAKPSKADLSALLGKRW